MQEFILIAFYLIILIYSIILHEVAHGVMALWLGDKTAKHAGRITANPISHIDFFWTILVPLIMYLSSGFAFGMAKPVPYNPYNLRNQKWGPAMVGMAGPGSNILVAAIAALIAKFLIIPIAIKIDIINNIQMANWSAVSSIVTGSFTSIIFMLCIMAIFWNVLLVVFNLIPIPPLDGSKLLFSIFPIKRETEIFFQQFGFMILLGLIVIDMYTLNIIGHLFSFFLHLFFGIAI